MQGKILDANVFLGECIRGDIDFSDFSDDYFWCGPINPNKPYDFDGDTVTIASSTLPQEGSLTINHDGDFSYTPEPETIGNIEFDFTISDSHGGTGTGHVYIQVLSSPENGVPNPNESGSGDGNVDGVSDAIQPHVESKMLTKVTGNRNWITVVAKDKSNPSNYLTITNVHNYISSNGGIFGEIGFQVCGLSNGNTADIGIFLMNTNINEINSYEKYDIYGQLHRYNFNVSKVGNAIKLSYTIKDGGVFDRDETEDGCIEDYITPIKSNNILTPLFYLLGT
jgi:hypothetical protein